MPGVEPGLDEDRRLLSLMAAQNTYRLWQNTWDNLYAQKKAA